MFAILRHREPALIVVGQTISNFGDGVSSVAFTLLIIHLTHANAVEVSLFVTVRIVPLVAFLLIGGVIVDRHSRRLLLLISDSARAVITGSVVVLALTTGITYAELLVAGVLFGTFDALFMPAITALTPEIVPQELLPAMNAIRPLSGNFVGGMIGPAVGGFIAAFSTTLAIGVDAGTFVASALFLACMRATPKPPRGEEASVLKEIRVGLGFVLRTKWMWTSLSFAALANALIFMPASFLVPIFLIHDLHVAKWSVGVYFALSGFAGTVGAFIVGSRALPRRRVRAMWTSWLISLMAGLLIAVATSVWLVLLVPLIMAPTMFFGNVVWESMMQIETPREMLGRISSVDWFVSLGLAPIGITLAGLIVKIIGLRTYFVVSVALCAAFGLYGLLSPSVNAVDASRLGGQWPRPTDPPPPDGTSDTGPVRRAPAS